MAAGFKQATVAAASVPSTQTNFPSYVDLSRLGITTLAEAQSVRVYADSAKTTEWAREIVTLTEMHVKVPSLTSTVTMYVDWDGVSADYAATDTYGRNAVWTDYQAVHHFETASTDSTSNARNGTDTNITYGAAKIGGGAFNTSKNGKIAIGSWSLTAAFSVTGWIKLDGITTLDTFWSTYNGSGTGSGTAQLFGSTGDGKPIYSNFAVDSSPAGATALAANTWAKLDLTHDGTTARIYINGTEVDTGSVAHATTTRTFNYMSRGDEATQRMDGYIDECRIRNAQLSADWITTEYNNQSAESTFWGTWTTVGGGATVYPSLLLMGVGS